MDLSLVDKVIKITDDAFQGSRALAAKEGIFAGASSGAAFAATCHFCVKFNDQATVILQRNNREAVCKNDFFQGLKKSEAPFLGTSDFQLFYRIGLQLPVLLHLLHLHFLDFRECRNHGLDSLPVKFPFGIIFRNGKYCSG